jgi:glycopeptide antibiotics resistance protein
VHHVQRPIVSSSADSARAGRWLLLTGASAALILYGSLFPFRIRMSADLDLFDLIETLAFKPATRGDVVANLLLYMPLGLCLMFAWSGGRTRWPLARTILVGTALSLAVELTQTYLRFRVSSLTDVALNAIGTLGGAYAAMAYGALGTSVRISALASTRLDPAALSVVLLWLGFRLAPFVPTIDWQKYKDALKPLFIYPHVGALEFVRYGTGWLVVSYAVRLLVRREYALAAALAIVGIVLFGRLVVVGKTLNVSELAALAACVPLAALLTALRDQHRAAVLTASLTVVIVVQGVAPFEFVSQAREFSWLPFRSSLSGSIETNYSALLEKCFWYFSLVWLLKRCGSRAVAAALTTASLVAAIEIGQMWLPGRSADVTDPLLALVAGLLLAMPARASDSRPQASRRARRATGTVARKEAGIADSRSGAG